MNALPPSASVLAAADLAPTLPAEFPLRITKTWIVEEGRLIWRFTLTHTSTKAVEIRALSIPMIFNNVLNDRSLEQAHTTGSFYDPYIGEDAGKTGTVRRSLSAESTCSRFRKKQP